MTGNDFRKAELIELHDASVVIHPQHYADAAVGWREHVGEDSQFLVLFGEDIARLLQHLGLETYPYSERASDQKRIIRYSLKDMEFPIQFRRLEVGGGGTNLSWEASHTIKELWAQADGERLLHIRFVGTYEDQDNAIQEYTSELSYSGSYTVWWG